MVPAPAFFCTGKSQHFPRTAFLLLDASMCVIVVSARNVSPRHSELQQGLGKR